MTREEAIHILDNLKPTNTKSSFDAYVVGKAITMAIKALEQESSGDNVVSRDVVKEQMIMYGFHAPDMTVTEFVEDLPPVNPKEPTTTNNIEVDYTINGLDDFIEFGKKAFGVELAIKKSDNPDTYEKLFETTKNDLGVDAISRADARSLICKIDIKHRMLGMSRKAFKDLYNGMDELPSITPQEPR